jgi:xylan 1,4-beta-xylosidase
MVTGPFTPNPDNPLITHRHLTEHPIQELGHGDLVETPEGWWLVCLGIRPEPPRGFDHHLRGS